MGMELCLRRAGQHDPPDGRQGAAHLPVLRRAQPLDGEAG